MFTSRRFRHAAMCVTFTAALLAGCQARVGAGPNSHAELTRAAERSSDEAVFTVGDTMGVRMTRVVGKEVTDAPVFTRSTLAGFQAADALGAMTLGAGRAGAIAGVDADLD